jgi:hypothetical protein
MSLISDALKKAELQRAASAKSAPGGWNRDVTPQEGRDIKRRSSAGLFWSNLFVLTALCVAAVYFLRLQPRDPTDDHTAATQNVVPATTNGAQPEVAAAQPAASASAQPPESLTASPFLSPATDTTTSPRVTEEYALDGVSALGSKLCSVSFAAATDAAFGFRSESPWAKSLPSATIPTQIKR